MKAPAMFITLITLLLAVAISPASAAPPATLALIQAVRVTPSPVVDYRPAALSIRLTSPGRCTARVTYASHYRATSHSLHEKTGGLARVVVLRWTPETKYPGTARAQVHCTASRLVQNKVVGFVVVARG